MSFTSDTPNLGLEGFENDPAEYSRCYWRYDHGAFYFKDADHDDIHALAGVEPCEIYAGEPGHLVRTLQVALIAQRTHYYVEDEEKRRVFRPSYIHGETKILTDYLL